VHFDLPTLVAMGSLVAASAGMVLLIAWSQNRKIKPLAIWGLANIVYALGVLCLGLGPALGQPIFAVIASSLLVLAPGLMWKAARTFEKKPAPLVLALLGAIVVVVANAIPGTRGVAGFLSLAAASLYLIASAAALWLGRREKLPARWPIVILMSVHAVVLLVGAYSTLTGSIGQGEVPAVMSLFGLIHFESIIFTLGTAAFILALVNERNEAASRMSARIDPLTGIANRAAFMESADRVVERCGRERAPVSVIMFDLDRFKAINDTHGHAVGDAVIREFCAVAVAAFRPNDVFGRMGGEEFAVVLPGSSIEAAFVRAERIGATFAENCRFVGERQINATVSGGVSMGMRGEQTLSVLLEYSDAALYRAKAEGRNRIKRAEQLSTEGDSAVIRVA
jgi:diguanylate cyclase (GGDEF)-like protein